MASYTKDLIAPHAGTEQFFKSAMKTTREFGAFVALILAGGCASSDLRPFAGQPRSWTSPASHVAAIGGIPVYEGVPLIATDTGSMPVMSLGGMSLLSAVTVFSDITVSGYSAGADSLMLGGSMSGLFTSKPAEVLMIDVPVLAPPPPRALTVSGPITFGSKLSPPNVTMDGVVREIHTPVR
jgi:hypothetical protein